MLKITCGQLLCMWSICSKLIWKPGKRTKFYDLLWYWSVTWPSMIPLYHLTNLSRVQLGWYLNVGHQLHVDITSIPKYWCTLTKCLLCPYAVHEWCKVRISSTYPGRAILGDQMPRTFIPVSVGGWNWTPMQKIKADVVGLGSFPESFCPEGWHVSKWWGFGVKEC